MICSHKVVSIIYGGSGKRYAARLEERISTAAETERYPITAKLIMERILTGELLGDVMDLFRHSEYCVAFLSADDVFETADGSRRRLRQNVVFELGMALYALGRERCILLADFDLRAREVELPSDMNSLEIFSFDPAQLDETIETVFEKLLSMQKGSEPLATRKQLLFEQTYHVDYTHLFDGTDAAKDGKQFLLHALDVWKTECKSLPFYDERAIYFLERIGFLPMFGAITEAEAWLTELTELLLDYSQKDAAHYEIATLEFVKNLIAAVGEYSKIRKATEGQYARYLALLSDFLAEEPPSGCNPLLSLVYADYLGLTYLKLFSADQDIAFAEGARDAFARAATCLGKVDLSLQIWAGFLYYNQARAAVACGDNDAAVRFFSKAVRIRERWLHAPTFHPTIRNALSSEYFVAEIEFATLKQTLGISTKDETLTHFLELEARLETYYTASERLERLEEIRHMLQSRKPTAD